MPTSVSEVAWEWSVPDDGTSLSNVLPGRSGPVMVLDDGAVGLDGATGEELWTYRAEEAGVQRAWVTPEGQEVVLALPRGGEEPVDIVVLDAGTGASVSGYEADLGFVESTGAVTEEAAVAVPAMEGGPVEAVSLQDGEPRWSYELPERPGSGGSQVHGVLVAGNAVVVVATYHDGASRAGDGGSRDQVMFAAGLDDGTGEPLWEVEREFAYDRLLAPKPELSTSGKVLRLSVEAEERAELLVDPATGEEIGGAAYQDRERYPVGLLDDGYVETAVDYDEGTVGYWHMSFEGEELAYLETRSRPGEGDIGRGLLLEEGVLRSDHLTGPDLDRGPVDVEFARWDSEDEPLVLNADMTVNEEWWFEPEGSATTLPDSPVLALVPGAVVVTEENPGPWTVVGLT